VAVFRRVLTSDESAVVVHRGADPELIRGPGSVRTFQRWRRVTVVSLKPFGVDVLDDDLVAGDGEPITASGSARAQVADPVAAATRVVDYRQAIRQIFRTAIRAAVKERPGGELRERAEEVRSAVEQVVVEAVGEWGIVVSSLNLHLSARPRSGRDDA